MPSAAGMSHQYLTSDVRYIDDHKLGGRAHAISIMDNHSRCILASASPGFKTSPPTSRCCAQRWRSTTPRRPSSPDGRRIFRAKQARAVYETLDIAKHEIVRGRSWQGYIETTVKDGGRRRAVPVLDHLGAAVERSAGGTSRLHRLAGFARQD
jgi:hypothetical protein